MCTLMIAGAEVSEEVLRDAISSGLIKVARTREVFHHVVKQLQPLPQCLI